MIEKDMLKDLAANHIELVYNEGSGYFFRIKGGKKVSNTSFHEWYKDYFPIVTISNKRGKCEKYGKR